MLRGLDNSTIFRQESGTISTDLEMDMACAGDNGGVGGYWGEDATFSSVSDADRSSISAVFDDNCFLTMADEHLFGEGSFNACLRPMETVYGERLSGGEYAPVQSFVDLESKTRVAPSQQTPKKRKGRPRVNRERYCQVCGKRFPRKANLDIHMVMHNGTLPHGCPNVGCEKRYRWKSSLAHHLRVSCPAKSIEQYVAASNVPPKVEWTNPFMEYQPEIIRGMKEENST